MVSWKGACGKHIEETVKVEDVLSWGEGVWEKPLRLVIGACTQLSPQRPSFPKWKSCRLVIGPKVNSAPGAPLNESSRTLSLLIL
jgi:hypothetical protein